MSVQSLRHHALAVALKCPFEVILLFPSSVIAGSKNNSESLTVFEDNRNAVGKVAVKKKWHLLPKEVACMIVCIGA